MILIQPSIDPIIISLGFIDIRWYSIAYILAFVFGSILIKQFNRKSYNLLSNVQVDRFFIWAVIGVIIGGRVGYVLFYQTNLLFLKPLYIFEIWKGGMSFHGGLIGIIFSIYLFSIKNSVKFFYLSDLVSIVAPIGLFLGRMSNFINTELYGRVTDFPFAIIYPDIDTNPRHPSQLYEAFLEGLILFLILNYLIFKKNYKIGNCSFSFLIYYGVFRIFSEFFRLPDIQIGYIIGFVSIGMLLSTFMIFAGIILYLKRNDL